MKKKVWNKSNLPVTIRNSEAFYLRLSKSGAITVSKHLVEKLDLLNHGLSFVQDEDRPTDWYMELISKDDPDAFTIRSKKDGTYKKGYIFQSAPLVKRIMLSCAIDWVSCSIRVAKEPTEQNLFAILTKSAKPSIEYKKRS